MKIEYEIVRADPGSSFRIIHHKRVRKTDFIWQYHYHPEYEIVYVPYGNGTRHVGNHLSNYLNGDLVLIGSNLPHSGFGINSSGFHEEIVVQVHKEVLPLHLTESGPLEQLLTKSQYGLSFYGNTKQQAGEKLMAIVDQPPFQRYLTMLEVFHILSTSDEYHILNTSIVSPTLLTKHKSRLQKVFTYVEQHYHNEIDIKTVAALVGLSVPSFCNFFKKATNITFSEFVNQYRIQRACILLHQDKSIAEVCFECGFNHVTYFNKLFKKIMNLTPSEFKKNMEPVT
ncbi:HTH-type transcriptional activator RhaS [Mycovorax composti]|jgi:AraC-type DNA-binding domain-containing proteins|uniref:HTH-type transcriptional activator RhaS n=2 Tax=Chitinophagaceae TaxID=563835 RepID=A0ABZ2EG08_9BACT